MSYPLRPVSPKAAPNRFSGIRRSAMTDCAPLHTQALLEAGMPVPNDPFLQAQAKKLQINAIHPSNVLRLQC
jgi:hypothetical protein